MKARRWLKHAIACVLGAVLALSGCGGVGSGGTGMESGVTVGTVSGFGSVIVDGDRFDDSDVAAFTETAPGVSVQAAVRLGERVEVESERGQALRLRVEPTAIGTVEGLLAEGFSVLGQTVRVNADASRGPVTQFAGGYGGLASVRPGDVVELHAFVRRTAGGDELQATRIQRRTDRPAFVRVSGLVGAVDASGFQLGGLRVLTGAAVVLPAGVVPAQGRRVSVLAPAAPVEPTPGAAPVLHAAQVRVASLGQVGDEVAVSGVIGLFDATAARFDLGGTAVDFAAATLKPKGLTLTDGLYVQARGTLQADGSLKASTLRLRDGLSEVEAELKGTLIGLDAVTLRFEVRGVSVDAQTAKLEGCPSGALAEGVFVEVEGRLGPTGVIAKTVHCEDEPDDAVVERKGVAADVDLVARRFALTLSGGTTLAVSWNELTYFENVGAATLAGQRVEVEGKLVDGVMQARKIEVKADHD